MSTFEYNARHFQLPVQKLRALNELQPVRSFLALARAWLAITTLVLGMIYFVPQEYFWWAYVPAVFLIASRYGVLLQLLHESAHTLISKNKKINDGVAKWLCASPVGISFEGYTRGHMRHHAWTNTENDPTSDTEKYKVVDFRDPALFLLLLKDLLGLTAFQVFFEYRDYEANPHAPKPPPTQKIIALGRMALCQVVILTLFFKWDLQLYFLLWLVPAISPHMFLMRIRGIAEHGLAKQLGFKVKHAHEGNFHTRSFLTRENAYAFKPFTWLEKTLIGTLNAHHHHEHHLFPTVPFYHLPELHAEIAPKVKELNPDIYEKGYFSAALRSLRSPVPVQDPSLQLNSV